VVSLPLPNAGTHSAKLQLRYAGRQYDIWIGVIAEARKDEEYSDGEYHLQTLSYYTNLKGGAIDMDE
jgi:hypothetical protein